VVGAPDANHGTGATWAQAQAYISATVSAIHSVDPGRLATCSTGWNKWNNLAHFKGLGLDFYDFHDYENAPSFPTAASLGMDKPIYIGGCGQAATSSYWDDTLQNNCELAALNSALSGGYAGVGIWDYNFPGSPEIYSMVNTNGSWRPVCYTIQGWNYGDDIWVDFSVTGPGTGTFSDPYNTLALGIAHVPVNGTVAIKGPGSTLLATSPITKPLKIDAWGGPVSLGK